MFARYDFKPGSLPADLIADLVKILTGTTDKALLSANCVQASSYIISDVSRPAGWELWDAAAGTNAQAIRSLNADGTTYKYVVIKPNSNNDRILFAVYEGWNATTHVGTNLTYYSDQIGPQASLTNGGTLFISASARGLVSQGWYNGLWDEGPTTVIEHSRDEPWDTVAHGVPCFGFVALYAYSSNAQSNSHGNRFVKPRFKYPGGTDTVGSSTPLPALVGPYNSGQNAGPCLYFSSPSQRIFDAAGALVHAFCPITLANENLILGKLPDIYLTTRGAGALADEAVFEGKTYFILGHNQSASTRIAVPKF